jgi:hypothetical protein
VIGYRHADPSYPFLWEDASQPAARWHKHGEGPVHYFADTPDGAWAEFLRHEEIKDPADLANIRRALWAVELPDEPFSNPALSSDILIGDATTYSACQGEAKRLRGLGATRLLAPSAALLPDGARGWRVDGGLTEGPPRDGVVVVLFGSRPTLVGWAAASEGRPRDDLLPQIRHF